MQIGDSVALCHITNEDISLYDVTKINKLVQGNAGNIPITNKGKLCISVCQVDGTKQVHILWPMKYCAKAGANLYSLAC